VEGLTFRLLEGSEGVVQAEGSGELGVGGDEGGEVVGEGKASSCDVSVDLFDVVDGCGELEGFGG